MDVETITKGQCMLKEPYLASTGMLNFDTVICAGGEQGKDSCNVRMCVMYVCMYVRMYVVMEE